jgi:GMP synthase-like glutamine amidotransferase
MAKPLRVHWLQHAPHEDSGCIAPWLREQAQVRATRTRLYAGERLPSAREFDWLIVLGGPMNVYEHSRHPWLAAEKALINDACVNKKVLGICLGAQLLADVLGGRVTENDEQEIGWFEVFLNSEAGKCNVFKQFPARFKAFHWHGDTFSTPPGTSNLMKSDACVNQAFHRDQRLVGMQFHLEVRASDARRWLKADSPGPARYVQDAGAMLSRPARFAANNRLMRQVLERMRAL